MTFSDSDVVALSKEVQQLLSSGDLKAAATEAIRGFGPQVLLYLRAVLRDESEAREAFSQWAENLWKGLRSVRGDSSFKTWSLRLACNAALNLRGDAWRRRGRRLATGEASALADDVRTRKVHIVEHRRRVLGRLRQSLTTEEQSLLALRIDLRLPWNEIAEVLVLEGKPVDPNTLMERFERLKDRLARLLKQQGLVDC